MPASTNSSACTAMGEPLYEEVVGPASSIGRAAIYAPVGTHETLLAYLVRRLLENGANTSFVNQIANPGVPLETLLADPVERARELRPVGAPHPAIALPRDLFGSARPNACGLDLANEQVLAGLAETVRNPAPLLAAPLLADAPAKRAHTRSPTPRTGAMGSGR